MHTIALLLRAPSPTVRTEFEIDNPTFLGAALAPWCPQTDVVMMSAATMGVDDGEDPE